MSAPRLSPLYCEKCHCAVPLADGAQVPCPHCGARVPLPEAHQALRTADVARALADKELAALYARLARPPSLFLRAWAAVTRVLVEATFWLGKGIGWAWLALLALFARLGNDAVRYFVLVSAILGLVLLFLGVSAVGGYTERYLGMDVWSVFPTWLVFGSMAGVVSTAFLLPGPLVSYLEAFTGARERARACLAARPPSLPGGPSLCRHCGAALSVMQGMRGARCA